MKERPILFSGPMVRAILDGRKTQTRRVVKPQDSWLCAPEPQVQQEVKPGLLESGEWGWLFDGCTWGIIGKCPYGVPGDRLYVREKWREAGSWQRSDGRIPTTPGPVVYAAEADWDGPWRPSIHMPRWASRITLEVTDVRVERVQDISEADAMAEGCAPMLTHADPSAREAFQELWDSINAKRGYGWDTNPWVFVITFKRVS